MALKGKMVLTEKYFGTVIEETERTITIQSVRRKVPNPDRNDSMRRFYGVPDPSFYWYSDNARRTMTIDQAGEIEEHDAMPDFLAEDCLGYRPPPMFLTTVIEGKGYIDW